MPGRGAWTKVGKDNGSIFYENIAGKPADGSTPEKGTAYKAVNLGVKAIQNRINKEGYTPALVADGVFGAKTTAGAKWFQAKYGLTADGKVGASTCKVMWRKPLLDAVNGTGVEAKYIFGQMMHESTADPGACGFDHEPDRGINQINLESSGVSEEQAHDPYFSMPFSVMRFQGAMSKYDGKGKTVQIACSIYQHNTPVGADSWYKKGTAPSATAQEYVDAVLDDAEGWA